MSSNPALKSFDFESSPVCVEAETSKVFSHVRVIQVIWYWIKSCLVEGGEKWGLLPPRCHLCQPSSHLTLSQLLDGERQGQNRSSSRTLPCTFYINRPSSYLTFSQVLSGWGATQIKSPSRTLHCTRRLIWPSSHLTLSQVLSGERQRQIKSSSRKLSCTCPLSQPSNFLPWVQSCLVGCRGK